MAKPRRMGTETSETRARLLDVTERILLTDGHAAISSRRVATDAGVTPALVHYYFATLDDLFLAVMHRRVEQQLERQHRLLTTSKRPLHALWKLNNDPSRTGLVLEFMSLARHRKAFGAELAAIAVTFRAAQLEALRDHIEHCSRASGIPPMAILVLLNHIAQGAVLEQAIGMDLGSTETRELVERMLDQLEGADEERDRTT
jgi:AcrR family transcriptional regulator